MWTSTTPSSSSCLLIQQLESQLATLKSDVYTRIHDLENMVASLKRTSVQPPPPPPLPSRNEFGREDISHLPPRYLSQCYIDRDVVGLLETLVFDEDCPVNQTVRYNRESETVEVWKSDAWDATLRLEHALIEMIQSAYRILTRHARIYKEDVVRMMDYDLDTFEDTKEYYEKLYDNDDNLQDPVLKELKSMLSCYS
jgi:hypothetical protein